MGKYVPTSYEAMRFVAATKDSLPKIELVYPDDGMTEKHLCANFGISWHNGYDGNPLKSLLIFFFKEGTVTVSLLDSERYANVKDIVFESQNGKLKYIPNMGYGMPERYYWTSSDKPHLTERYSFWSDSFNLVSWSLKKEKYTADIKREDNTIKFTITPNNKRTLNVTLLTEKPADRETCERILHEVLLFEPSMPDCIELFDRITKHCKIRTLTIDSSGQIYCHFKGHVITNCSCETDDKKYIVNYQAEEDTKVMTYDITEIETDNKIGINKDGRFYYEGKEEGAGEIILTLRSAWLRFEKQYLKKEY